MLSRGQGFRKRQVVTLWLFDLYGVLCISVLLYVLYVKLRQGTAKLHALWLKTSPAAACTACTQPAMPSMVGKKTSKKSKTYQDACSLAQKQACIEEARLASWNLHDWHSIDCKLPVIRIVGSKVFGSVQ